MNKSVMKSGFILVMGMLVICALTVPAIARNTTDAECEVCFGAMPPEITEIQTHGLKKASSSSGEVEEVVIWRDDFSTDPFNGRWYLPSGTQYKMGWDGDSVYLLYTWWDDPYQYRTGAQTMCHSFSTNNPFYGYYSPKVEYTFKSYSDDGKDAGFEVAFGYKYYGTWQGNSQFHCSPEEYASWTTKNIVNLDDYWAYVDWGDEYCVTVYEDADYSNYPHGGTCSPLSEVKGHVYITDIKLIGTPNKPPYKPSNPSPADGAGGSSANVRLSWDGGDPNGGAVKYSVYLGTSPRRMSRICENTSRTTCDSGTLDNVWSFYSWSSGLTIDFPAEGDTPTIHKDENGDSYINIGGTVIPSDYMSPGCLVTIYGPSDQLLGEWCTDQSLLPLSIPTMRAFSVRAYVSDATINLTGETTLTTYWMRGDSNEVSGTVTVNLPTDHEDVVWGYVGDVPVCLTPEDMGFLEKMKAEAERLMQRDGIADAEASFLMEIVASIDIILDLKEHPDAKVSGRALKILTLTQAIDQTKETGGQLDDVVKRSVNSFVEVIPFTGPLLAWAWEFNRAHGRSIGGPLDTLMMVPPWGFMEAGVETTGEYLPPNYYRNWLIGHYIGIGGNISGIMVKLDHVYMGPGDYFTIYKGDSHLIREWESIPNERYTQLEYPIPDEVGRIIVDCDDSGADSYGYKFDPECWIFLMCHHAEYYNYNGTGTHLVKLGTEATELNFSWGMGSPYPDVNVDNWMVVWSGQIYAPSNDTYTFYVASEDGTVDMKINRTDIVSNHIFSDHAEANSSTHLCKGWHNFAIWYHHTTGNASFVLSWANSTMSKQVVPDKNMRTPRTELASLPMSAFFSHKLGFSTNTSFTDLSFGDNITEWRWNFGDGTPYEIYNTSTNPTHTYDWAGTYNVTLTVVNGTGGMNTYRELVDVPLKGDANHDGTLSAADAVLILQMAACGINSDPAADVNSDGVITSLDALMVSQAVMKGASNE